MREILFRGKRIDDNKWVEGGIMRKFHPNYPHESGRDFFFQKENCYVICANNRDIFVAQNTIGQFTGLTDKNGDKIFEGDIVKIICVLDDSERVTAVMYDSGLFGVKHKDPSIPSVIPLRAYDCYSQIEVIGNIHDNSELLKGEQHD